ncbi:MAG: ABC transporter permease, partial [Pseudolabrys sp.]|nr:ABC transporter permease [Pseudolabrys sp.]
MTTQRTARYTPQLVGAGSLLAFLAALELLIRAGVITRFIVPPPTEIIASFGRVMVEEHVLTRFLLTFGECLAAGIMLTVVGVATGVLMHRYRLLQQAC